MGPRSSVSNRAMRKTTPQLAAATFLFMSGNAYPNDQHIEMALCERLPGTLLTFGSLIEKFAGGNPPIELVPRLAFLRHILSVIPTQNLFLVGRSSGARAMTRLAADFTDPATVAGIVCLGYPFRHPEMDHEPDRVDHLTRLRVPTLILQGDEDTYGNRLTAPTYPLSDSTRLEFVPGTHVLTLPPEGWDALADRICAFAASHMTPAPSLQRAG